MIELSTKMKIRMDFERIEFLLSSLAKNLTDFIIHYRQVSVTFALTAQKYFLYQYNTQKAVFVNRFLGGLRKIQIKKGFTGVSRFSETLNFSTIGSSVNDGMK